MKLSILFLRLFFIIPIYLFAQTNNKIEISGKISGTTIETGTIQFFQINGSIAKFDSNIVTINHNRFKFMGNISSPELILFGIINSPVQNFMVNSFFIDSGKIAMECIYDDSELEKTVHINGITGIEYEKQFLPGYKGIKMMFDTYLKQKKELKLNKNNITKEKQDELNKYYELYKTKRDDYFTSYSNKYPTSIILLWKLAELAERGTIAEIINMYNNLDDRFKNTPIGLHIQNAINIKSNNSVELKLKTTSFLNSKNDSLKLEFNKNKYTLVDFWYSHCRPCIAQFPLMKNIYQTYRNKGFGITGISVDKATDSSDWQRIIEKYELKWNQLWDKDGRVAELMYINSFPNSFLFDSTGKLIQRNIKPYELENFLKDHLQK